MLPFLVKQKSQKKKKKGDVDSTRYTQIKNKEEEYTTSASPSSCRGTRLSIFSAATPSRCRLAAEVFL
jgi:hypothetical protein